MDSLLVYKSPHKKIRMGRPHDGGYVTCELPGGYDCLIGCGISNDVSFEQSILDKYGPIPCFGFDGTIPRLPVNDSRITFVRKNVGAVENAQLTNLHSYIDPYTNIFMKMDIEGHEFRVLPTLSREHMMKIKQIVLEVHSPGDIRLHPTYFVGLSDITDEFMLNTLSKIKETHTLVHVHPNNGCKTHHIAGIFMPNVFECTFVRNDFIAEHVLSDEPVPSSIDMRNIRHMPELSLSGYPWNTL